MPDFDEPDFDETVDPLVPVRDEKLGPYAGTVRGPLDHDRLGVPALPGKLFGGRTLIGRFLPALSGFPNATLAR
ncbi:hypothetical protein [Candidatus Mycolicibacterium alkanivorans]|uniref:Uncharacterized protein n=1 Tax=Candidatus Mycolicibacterium alkanivorans TaxID=2954114 RepID=A0ABS9YY06_9MYCO|nr:hypothetical protein [Candidatus Mycolicibacterium alkanivorans]MCI4675968.1 hypothetical protein [Candidatus Mycolicibacterium alkanivorans]